MIKIARTKAEKHFAAAEKREHSFVVEREKAAGIVRKKTAKLKALRLLKEAEDLQA